MMCHDVEKERLTGRAHSTMKCKRLTERAPTDIYAFKIIDLKNPESNRPVMWGDDVWLQIGNSYDDGHMIGVKVVGAKVDKGNAYQGCDKRKLSYPR